MGNCQEYIPWDDLFSFLYFCFATRKKKIIFKILKHIIKTNKQANILSPTLDGLKFRFYLLLILFFSTLRVALSNFFSLTAFWLTNC